MSRSASKKRQAGRSVLRCRLLSAMNGRRSAPLPAVRWRAALLPPLPLCLAALASEARRKSDSLICLPALALCSKASKQSSGRRRAVERFAAMRSKSRRRYSAAAFAPLARPLCFLLSAWLRACFAVRASSGGRSGAGGVQAAGGRAACLRSAAE